MDEYILIPGPGPVANQPHANVYAGAVPPAAAWANLVGATDYALGGHYQNWWRASPSSVMLNLDTGYFNSVSQVLLNQAIDTYAGKWVDPSKPIAKIASPADGSVVSGMVTITPRVGDNRGIAWVQLWKDGVLWSTAYTAPYPLTWNATREAEGLHTLQVRAVDAAGNVGVSETHLVYIDTTRPTVSITSPTHNANVQGIVNVGVNATDRSGISHVTLSVDGVVIATTTTAPYVLPWDARSTSGNARKTLVVTAYDRAGLKNSTQVVVTARGVRDVIAPTVRILAPTPRRAVSVSDVMTVQVNARDNVGIKALWVRLDGRVVAHDEQAPFGTYQVALSPFAKRRGLRTLQVVVQDLAGNMGRSQPVPIRLV
jgi:chitinase